MGDGVYQNGRHYPRMGYRKKVKFLKKKLFLLERKIQKS